MLTHAAAAFLACALLGASASAQAARHELWQQDVDFVLEKLPKLHVNAFAKLPEKEWRAAGAKLRASFDESTTVPQFAAGMMRWIASLGDGHTSFEWWNVGWDQLPIRLMDFQGHLYVVMTGSDEKSRALRMANLVSIDGHPVADLREELSAYLSHDNQAFLTNNLPQLLTMPALLHAIGRAKSPKQLTLAVRGVESDEHVLEAVPFRQLRSVRWQLAALKPMPFSAQQGRLPWFRKHIEERGALYLQYNRCQDRPAFERFVATLFGEKGSARDVRYLIVDLRYNGGGDSRVIQPLYDAIAEHEHLKRPGAVRVLIGRRTYSSALLNAIELKAKFDAPLYGEPTGGKPNHFGEVRRLQLPQSRLAIRYSTKFFRKVPGDPESLMPDHAVPPSLEEWMYGRDPVLKKVLIDLELAEFRGK